MFEIIFDIIGALLSPFIDLFTDYLLIPTIIIAVILFIVYLVSSNNQAKEAAKAAEEQAEKDRIQAEQYAKDSKFNEWENKLISCYDAIEKNVRLNILFDPKDLYEHIWDLEKVQPEPRYKTAFDQRLSNHIKWLRERIDYNLQDGYYAGSMSVTSARCLRKAYHNDSGFDSAIKTLTRLYKRSQSNSFYIEFPQYGDCKVPVLNLANQADLDARIAELKNKMQAIDSAFQQKDAYYRNIIPDMANYIDYAAELIWCIAVKKPFNQDEFDKARKLFARHTEKCSVDGNPYVIVMYEKAYNNKNGQKFWQMEHVEQLLALIYAKNLIGGQNTANQERKRIINWVDAAIAFGMTEQCYMLPSALAWMGLFELEREVLRYLVEQKVNLKDELQDRLGFLESGGTSNIKIYEVDAEDALLYDASASDWNNDAFDLFFRKLEMTHKELHYSLAISKWTKAIPLASGQKISQEQIEHEFAKLVADYDKEVVMSRGEAKALNLENVKYDENSFIFKFASERNRCVSILFSSEKYGRNLNTTIITMFTPESGLSNEQLKKYALAIKDNIYVESFRESIFQVVDEVTKEEKKIYDDEDGDKALGKKIFS